MRAELATALPAGAATADVTDDTALIVTELLTNAIAAGCTTVRIGLTIHHTHLVITVDDDAAGRPQLMAADVSDPRGRGLTLVHALARAWTVQEHVGRGKNVRVELALPPELTGQVICDPAFS